MGSHPHSLGLGSDPQPEEPYFCYPRIFHYTAPDSTMQRFSTYSIKIGVVQSVAVLLLCVYYHYPFEILTIYLELCLYSVI